MNDENMNAKKNNGWILCPSKSFPGKFYYFNVVNGDTAWSLSEAEKKSLKIDTPIQKVFKPNCYPEPTSPPNITPIYKPSNATNISRTFQNQTPKFVQPSYYDQVVTPTYSQQYPMYGQQLPTFGQPHPMFGQAIFPKHLPNVTYTPNVVWTPVQMPMFVTPEVNTEMLHYTTTSMSTVPDRELFIQHDGQPLGKRLINYEPEKPVLNFDNQSKTECDKFFSSTAIKQDHLFQNDETIFNISKVDLNYDRRQKNHGNPNEPQIRDPKITKENSQKQNPGTDNFINPIQFEQNKILSIAKDIDYEAAESEHYASKNKSHNSAEDCDFKRSQIDIPKELDHKAEVERNVRGKPSLFRGFKENLDKNDLRMILIAKKRKFVDTEQAVVKGKMIKTTKQPLPVQPNPKKVTFNLDHDNSSDGEIYKCAQEQVYNDENLSIDDLRNFGMSVDREWYIVVDSDVLLEKFNYLDDFVQQDPNCRLVILSCVLSDLIATARDSASRRVTVARQLLRRLATHQKHIIVHDNEEYDNLAKNDSILGICLEFIKRNTHVILITNDENIKTKAKSLKINAFKLNEIKEEFVKKPQPKFDIKKTKVSVDESDNGDTGVKSETHRKKLFDGCNNVENEGVLNNNSTEEFNKFKDKLNLNNLPKLFKIHRNILTDSTEVTPIPNTSKESEINRQEDTSRFIQNDKNNESQNETVSFSIQHRNSSIFDIDKDDRINNNIKKLFDKTNISKSFLKEIYETKESKTENAIIDGENKEIEITNEESFDNTKAVLSERKNMPLLNFFLARYYVKHKVMEDRIISRIDEWLCHLRQVLEDCFSTYVMKSSLIPKKLSPPWSLHEEFQCIKMLHGDHVVLKQIVDNLTELWFEGNTKTDVIKSNLQPFEFMKVVGTSLYLIHYLKNISPHADELKEAENVIHDMLGNVENPFLDCDPNLVQAPAVNRTDKHEDRKNFAKPRSEIVNYLKKHFINWQSYNAATDAKQKLSNVKIVRTQGKNLSFLKIDKSNQMSYNETDEKQNHICGDNNKARIENAKKACDRNLTFERNAKEEITLNEDSNVGKSIEYIESVLKNPSRKGTQCKLKDEKLENPTSIGCKKDNPNNFETRNSKIVKRFDNIKLDETSKQFNANENKIDLDYVPHQHSFGFTDNGPKIVRNLVTIDAFESKMKSNRINKLLLDSNKLHYSASTEYKSSYKESNENSTRKRLQNDNLASKDHTRNEEYNDNYKKNSFNENNKISITKRNDEYEEKINYTSHNDNYTSHNDNYTSHNDNYTSHNDNYTSHNANYTNMTDFACISHDISDRKQSNNKTNSDVKLHSRHYSDVKDDIIDIGDLDPVVNDLDASNDSNNDSGFESESVQAYVFVKSFLIGLSKSFNVVQKFIVDSIRVLNNNKPLDGDAEDALYSKTNEINSELEQIIHILKRIIQRESGADKVIVDILACAGLEASEDMRVKNYTEVVKKFLEQAEILLRALKIMLAILTGVSCGNHLFDPFELQELRPDSLQIDIALCVTPAFHLDFARVPVPIPSEIRDKAQPMVLRDNLAFYW